MKSLHKISKNIQIVFLSFLTLNPTFSLFHSSNSLAYGADDEMSSPATAQNQTNAKINSSPQLLKQMMNDPMAADSFRRLLQELLSSPADKILKSYLSSPELIPLMKEVLDVHNQSIDEFIATNMGHDNLVPHNTEIVEQKFLLNLIKGVAQDLGFPNKAIDELKFFIHDAGGEQNAFTVSGSPNKIVIVLNKALIGNMSNEELKAIVGHELGHILMGHSLNGYALDYFFNLIIQRIAKSKTKTSLKEKLKPILAIFSKTKPTYDWSDVKLSPMKPMAIIDKEFSMIKKHYALNSNSIKDYLILMAKDPSKIFSFMSNKNTDPMLPILDKFLDTLILVTKIMGGNDGSQTTNDISSFIKNLKDGLVNPEKLVLNPKDFKSNLETISTLISMAQEMSSDIIGGANAKNEQLALSMLKLIGMTSNTSITSMKDVKALAILNARARILDLNTQLKILEDENSSNSELIKRLNDDKNLEKLVLSRLKNEIVTENKIKLQQILQQALIYISANGTDVLSSMTRFAEGHPQPVPRTHIIMSLPVVPQIFIANPFTRNLVLFTALYHDSLNASTDTERAHFSQQIELLSQSIVQSILEMETYQSFNSNNFNLLNETAPRFNPRFYNLVQFLVSLNSLTLKEMEPFRNYLGLNAIKTTDTANNFSNFGDFLIKELESQYNDKAQELKLSQATIAHRTEILSILKQAMDSHKLDTSLTPKLEPFFEIPKIENSKYQTIRTKKSLPPSPFKTNDLRSCSQLF